MFRHVRMGAAVVGYAAGVTALLSVIGLYGVLAFGVAAGNRESGI